MSRACIDPSQIISILDIIKPPSIEQFKEVYRTSDVLRGHVRA